MFDRDPFAADPERMDTVSVGQFVVERGASAVADLQDHPEVQVRLLPLLWARLHGQLGSSERALSHARRAVALVDSLGTPTSASALRAYTEIGTALDDGGEYQEAIDYFRRALTLSDAIHGREHQRTAVALGDLGNALANTGDSASVAEAIVLGEEALDVAQRVLGPDHIDVALAHTTSAPTSTPQTGPRKPFPTSGARLPSGGPPWVTTPWSPTPRATWRRSSGTSDDTKRPWTSTTAPCARTEPRSGLSTPFWRLRCTDWPRRSVSSVA